MTRRTGKCRNGVAGWRLGCTLPDRSRLVGTDPGHLSSGQQFLKGSTVTYQRATKSVCWSVKAILFAEEMLADSEKTIKVGELTPCADRLPPVPDRHRESTPQP